ncbi:amino acid ABC transporter permease [Paenibacillus sp. UASWS1643]|uniref:amino acid ABC transporter permease n=1 Tax=Paenibacillus sp. UASWS1643 TaxID=2580422 RepID=UPI00123B84F0|nr:amino acid ABC transporter permease [Paenibacillus sp. UASWS1643]KAA8757603.1 amino acid ABC transporter permease [Paenibacillus sp. UASWS1643]
MNLDFSFLLDHWQDYARSAWVTLELSFFGVLFGTLLGVIMALMRLSRIWPIKFVASAYIELIRGTPMLVQILIIHYGLTVVGVNLPAFMSGVVALTMNSSAYMAEVFRAGIQAIDKGQTETSRSLGMTHGMTLRYIILPQAFRNMLPAIGNEFIIIIKDSSLVSMIGIAEIIYTARTIQGVTFQPLAPLLVAAGLYFIITFTLANLLSWLERRLSTSR